MSRDKLYKNRSSQKIDSWRLFSREYDFPKTSSLTENQFSRKTYFYYNCLQLAILIYTFYPRVMDGNVAHLRRHFALNMLVAMLVQILRGFGVIQKEKNNVACPAIGKD